MGSQGRTEDEAKRREAGPAGEEGESLGRLWEKVSGSKSCSSHTWV